MIKLMQLASLAFPSHPGALGLIPDTLAVKEYKARPAAGGRAVALVQMRDTFGGDRQQFRVARHSFARAVSPV